MSTITPPPSDVEVQRSVDRVGEELFERLRERPRHPLRRRVLLGIGGFTLAGALVGGGGAMAGVWHLPGEATDAVLSEWRTVAGTGSRDVDLGAAPEGSTWLSVRITCVDEGEIYTELGGDGLSMACGAGDVGLETSGSPTFALDSGSEQLAVTAAEGVEWKLAYRFVDREFTPWKTNANGETYGVLNENGAPDLEAVGDSEGHVAYIRGTERQAQLEFPPSDATPAELDAFNLEHADDVTTIPAYKSDGVTIIGEWVTGGDDGGLRLFD